MATIRLYDEDVRMTEFTAAVRTCVPDGKRWALTLDRTAFFPEAGGQMADRGTLNGLQVLDVREAGDEILHFLAEPVPAGAQVTGLVDWPHRWDMMQQHSGEHVFSGILCREHHCDNVGFHIGPEELTVDFRVPLSEAQVARIELLANEAIWRDIPIVAHFPSPEELARMSYRSKKALTGPVRIVSIEGVDTCACCGTHVAATGQIGQIKVTDCRNYKGGVRITLKCGLRALREAVTREQECRAISHITNGKWGEVASAVERLAAERDELKTRCEELAMTCFRMEAERETGSVRLVTSGALNPSQLRKAAAFLAGAEATGIVLLPRENGWNLAICSNQTDVRAIASALTAALGGKAGGSAEMVQGALNGGTAEEIHQIACDALR